MNIHELLQEAGVQVWEAGEHHHVTHGWIGITCPYCGPNEAKLGIPLERPVVASCWSCGAHSVYDVLIQLGGPQLARLLKKVEFVDPIPKATRRGTLKEPKGILPLQACARHEEYLRERNLNLGQINLIWKVKGIKLSTKYGWSLYIPVTLDGEAVSFTTRGVRQHNDGYRNATPDEEAVSSKDVLYGADLARGRIIVCEGPLDAWAVGVGGTATFGLAYTRQQLLQMTRFQKVVVCYDAEPKAQQVARKLCDDLSVFKCKVLNVVLDSGKDPSRASERELKQLRRLIL